MHLLIKLTVLGSLLLVGCSQDPIRNSNPQKATAAHLTVNPLSEAGLLSCAQLGGETGFARELDGTRTAICQLSNGKRCGEIALIGGDCRR